MVDLSSQLYLPISNCAHLKGGGQERMVSVTAATDPVPAIVIVDDVPTCRIVMRSMLEDLGFDHVLEANDGSEALALIKSNQQEKREAGQSNHEDIDLWRH